METQTEGARTGRGKLLEFQNGQTPVYEILEGAFAENIIEKVSTNQHRTSHTGNPLLYDVVGAMPVRPVISVSCPSHSGRSNLSIFFFPTEIIPAAGTRTRPKQCCHPARTQG